MHTPLSKVSRPPKARKILIAGGLQNFMPEEQPLFRRADFKVFTAATGKEALAIHKVEKVDLIIASMHMYNIPGDELCSIIRREKDLKYVSFIILCTNTKADLEKAAKCGANESVVFPIRPDELMSKVIKFLNVKKRQDYRVLLKIEMHGEMKNTSFFSYTRDISASGLMIETDKVLNEGDILNCSFFLPNSEQVVTNAEVMRKKKLPGGFHYGVRFVNLGPKYKAAIEAFVEAHN